MANNPTESYTGVYGFIVLYFKEFWRYMITGMLVWVPLMITAWVTWFFVERFVLGTESLIRDSIDRLHLVTADTPFAFVGVFHYYTGMGALVVIGLFLTTGFLTRFIIGRRVIAVGESIVDQIPLISRVYRSVQQIRDTFVGRQGSVFQHVCLIEYPRKGIIAVGFVTSEERGIVQEGAGKDLHAVFIPTTPNPTSGFLLYLPPEEITHIDITVEEAMKLIVSGGAYIPGSDDKPPIEEPVPEPKPESSPT